MMQQTDQVKTRLDTKDLLKATGGNSVFFNQMLNTFIENSEDTYRGLEDGLRRQDWKQIGEKAHKAMPSFKYFALADFVEKFKTLEDITIRQPEYHKVPDMVRTILAELDKVIDEARDAKIPVEK